jgi:type II secretory pathway component GspD/PulD (secretin)
LSRSRRWSTSAPLVAGLALSLAGVIPAWAVSSSDSGASAVKSPSTVTLRLQDAPLTTAINFLTQQADVVIANNDGLKNKTVTVNLKDKPIEQALDQLLTPNGIPWYRDDDGTYMINATRPAPKVDATPAENTASILPAAPEPAPAKRFVVTEKIDLIHISPEDALSQLGLGPTGLDRRPKLLGSDNAYQMGTYGSPKTPLNILNSGGFQSANPTTLLTPRADANDSGPFGTDPTSLIPQSADAVNDGFNRSPEARDEFGQAPNVRRGFQPRQNVPGGAPNAAGVPPGAPGANNTANGANGGRSVAGFVPPGIDLVAGLFSDNSLLVQGQPDDIDELRSVVRLLDIAPQQVSIKVDVITVSTSALRQFGASWQFFTREANIRAQFGNVPDGLTVDVIRGNVQAVVGALTTNGRGRVIASPIVTTQNNTPANISQGTSTPVFLPVISTNVGGTISQTVVVPVSATTGLQVQPRVNRDGTITVNGFVSVQNIVRIVSSPDGTTVAPETNFTSLGPFVRRVANGETLVIGGLNSKNESDQETRVPLLSDIPFIGRFFRSRSRNNQENQLLIFITPTIVSEHANQGEAPP